MPPGVRSFPDLGQHVNGVTKLGMTLEIPAPTPSRTHGQSEAQRGEETWPKSRSWLEAEPGLDLGVLMITPDLCLRHHCALKDTELCLHSFSSNLGSRRSVPGPRSARDPEVLVPALMRTCQMLCILPRAQH